MANSYDVRLTFDVNAVPFTLVFRSDMPLEPAVQLANSLWLSTDNKLIAVSVCEKDGSIPSIIYHQRGE